GGMIVPALIYWVLQWGQSGQRGWAVPMATDIAFAVGVLALLGKRVPPALRVLLLALAVIDDLGAILVIALFYSAGVNPLGFAVAGAGLLTILLLQRLGVRAKAVYLIPGIVTWAGTYVAGIHPTIAGVVIGLLTPVRAWLGSEGFVAQLEDLLARRTENGPLSGEELRNGLHEIEVARREAISPLDALVEGLHPWVAFVIMPAFALANAGVPIEGIHLEGATGQVALGVLVGLVVGKCVGVFSACQLTRALGLTALPKGLGTRHLLVLGMVAGIGFTMALFVAQLAFASPALLGAAKLGVLAASGIAGVLSVLLGRFLLPATELPGAARTAHEAEGSTDM
ncbi:MAG TPA: Na+/H+ antiporter NhaA, partial [Polyangiaceae bacterium]|nr:Na+/H+ antiporter NhaA [Polyangiaceae bacterium]